MCMCLNACIVCNAGRPDMPSKSKKSRKRKNEENETVTGNEAEAEATAYIQSAPIQYQFHRCLIFAQHKKTLDLVEECVLSRYFPSIAYERMDG